MKTKEKKIQKKTVRKNKYTIGNFRLRVGRGVSGKGLFAETEIPKSSCIIEYIGTPVAEKDQYKVRSKYLFWVGKNKMINGWIPENKAKYINHSCRPNCEADGPEGHIYILTLRKIKAGEELTYNYGKEYFNEYLKDTCRCVKCKNK